MPRGRIAPDVPYFKSLVLSENEAYFLGFTLADGGINGANQLQWNIQEQDEDILYWIARFLDIPRKPKHYLVGKSTLYFSNKPMLDRLKRWGVFSPKSLECKYPRLEGKVKASFVRGFFDGDGVTKVEMVEVAAPRPDEIFFPDAFKKVSTNSMAFVDNINDLLNQFLQVSSRQSQFTIKSALTELGAPDYVVSYIASIHVRQGMNFA